MPSKAQSTVSPEILSFFRDPDASSVLTLSNQQITAPTIRGQDLTDEEIGMGGGVRIVILAIDGSPSMEPVTKLMITGLNDEYVAAVKEAREDDVAALRVGGVVFSSDVEQVWVKNGVSFHKIEELPKLTSAEYNPQRGNGTALHQAVIDAYHLALSQAAKIQGETGIQPEIDVIVLSDGYNNCAPRSKDPVRTLIEGTRKELVRFVFFYFETDNIGACQSKSHDVNPILIAQDLGFDSENVMGFGAEPGETQADLRKRFRRMMRVLSKVSASKGVSAVKAAAATPATQDIL